MAPTIVEGTGGDAQPAEVGAPESADAAPGACNVGAIVADPDPAGLNVRDAPKGRVIGQVYANAIVHLADAQDGWVRIVRVWDPEREDRTDWPLGWVHGSKLTTCLKTPADYGPVDEQDRPRQVELAGQPKSAGTPIRLDPVPTVSVKGCSENWLEVVVAWQDGAQPQAGWLAPEDHCPNSVTTCP